MTLKDTVELMTSEDYKDRLRGEYWQTKCRYEQLHTMFVKYDAGTLSFTPAADISLLQHQAATMGEYLYLLEVRAEMEGIDLFK